METNFLELIKIENKETYDAVRAYMDTLIFQATELGLLNDTTRENEYTGEIARIAILLNGYEKTIMNLFPKRTKNPLIVAIENSLYSYNLKQKEAAAMLGVTEAALSAILKGKKKVTMDIAQKLHKTFNIDANTLIEFA